MQSLVRSLFGTFLLFGAAVARDSEPGDAWSLTDFKSLVLFGDSFTDEGRLGYIISHNLTLPPIGYFPPEVSDDSIVLLLTA